MWWPFVGDGFVFKHTELEYISTRHPLKHWTSLGVGSHNINPLRLASIIGDHWQTTLESNVGSPTMNIDEVGFPFKTVARQSVNWRKWPMWKYGWQGFTSHVFKVWRKELPKRIVHKWLCNVQLWIFLPYSTCALSVFFIVMLRYVCKKTWLLCMSSFKWWLQ